MSDEEKLKATLAELAAMATQERESQTDVLLKLAGAARLFHDADGTAFADIMVKNHRETHQVRKSAFRSWLTHLYYVQEQRAPNGNALDGALATIVAKAQFDGELRSVNVRTAEHDGRLYIDLCNDAWQAVEIDVDDWRVIDEPPVRFIRSAGMLPLPVPVTGGKLEELKKFINVKEANDFILVAVFTLASMLPSGPYAILVLTGREGSAKSTLMEILRALIDPNKAPIRALPREEADLFISAANGHMLAYDNVSRLRDWLSDAFCRIATGGAFAKRQLYKDAEEVLLDACQPISLNGIQDFVAAPDLADRSLFLALQPLTTCIPEKELWERFEAARPRILGALLDVMVHGLSTLPDVKLPWSPRLADFAKWGTACQGKLGRDVDFMKVYAANRGEAAKTVIEGNTVASTVVKFMEKRAEWKGSATELLRELEKLVDEKEQKEKEWPKRANTLSRDLRAVAGVLLKVGISIKFNHDGKRSITIEKEEVGKSSSVSSDRQQSNETNGSSADDDTTGTDDAYDGLTTFPPKTPLKTAKTDGADGTDDVLPTKFPKASDNDPFERLKTDFRTNRKLQ